MIKPRPVAVPVSREHKKSRYDWPPLSAMRGILEALEERGFLIRHPAASPGLMKTAVLTPEAVRSLCAQGIGPGSVAWSIPGEVLILSSAAYSRGRKVRVQLDYRDNATTRKFRAQITAINAHLAAAQIDFVSDTESRPVHTGDRMLTRRFNVPPRSDGRAASGWGFKWNTGGRLFGGWWQELKKRHRHRIRITGEPIADLDFSGMFPRLAAIRMGAGEIAGDPYAVPGLEGNRAATKKMMNAMLFARGALRQYPGDLDKSHFGGLPVREVRRLIHHHHPFLMAAEGKSIGYDLMFTESEILVACLLEMNAEGITALPMHDGVMVAESRAERAMAIMADVAGRQLGVGLPVLRKPVSIGDVEDDDGEANSFEMNHGGNPEADFESWSLESWQSGD